MADVRPIDANALINVLCAKLCRIDNGRTMRQAAIPVADGMRIMELEYCIGLIQCADIIDAAPVVHGRWESCDEDWRHQLEGNKCSVCGFEYYGNLFKYCPDCGAKMDGGADNV